MWKYYFGLFRDIPRAFRSTLEAWVFWGWGAASLALSISPTMFGVLPNGKVPGWIGPGALGTAFLYGILRANYQRFHLLQGVVERYERRTDEVFHALCEAYERAGVLAIRAGTIHASGVDAWVADAVKFAKSLETDLHPKLDPLDVLKIRQVQYEDALPWAHEHDRLHGRMYFKLTALREQLGTLAEEARKHT